MTKQKINIEEKKLAAIESLLSLSLRGIHHLFDHREIARILSTPTENIDFFSFDRMSRIQKLFLELIEQKTFEQKQEFLKRLDKDSYEIVVRAYFHIVENTALAAKGFKH